MAKSHRQGPDAEFWADPTADPARLVLHLGLWPHNTDPLCMAAIRKRAESALATPADPQAAKEAP